VIEAIAKVKPKKLYISQDGPRNPEEEKEVLNTREAVLSKINWDCQLTVWIHKKNLGLKKHIPGAFDKFFKKEKYGIYLEDDTLPNEDFFYFQKKMLERYKYNNNIFYIKSTNFYPHVTRSKYSYFSTQLGSVWGLGIWKRSWNLYDRDITNLKDFNSKNYGSYIFSKKYIHYLKTFLYAIKNGKLDTWDYQLNYTAIKNRMYFIAPSVNLIRNVGINNNSTNLFLQDYESMPENLFPLKHPEILEYDKSRDVLYFDNLMKYYFVRMFLIGLSFLLPVKLRKGVYRRFISILSFIKHIKSN